MCIAFILWQHHPRYRFYLALNRDELLSRPTLPVHWWTLGQDEFDILGGKDLCKGGTWFGCTKNGRIALVTNFREVLHTHDAISRGELVTSFLKGSQTPSEYVEEVSEAGEKYNGFNILVADLSIAKVAYVSNRPQQDPIQIRNVLPGFHVLCNASLDTPWPKALRGKDKLQQLIDGIGSDDIPKEHILKEILMDDVKADKAHLPKTGCSLEWEHKMSSICVNCNSNEGPYGTRSMILFSVDNHGQVHLYERFLDNNCWKEHEFDFKIPPDVWKDA